MVKTATLNNGIRIIAKKLEWVKSLSMGVYVGAGSSYETDSENGLAHFIEHVNFKGTKKRSAFDISRDSDALGIILNASTSKECTNYYAKTISEHTEKALEILADIFIDSVYPKAELKREKGVVIEEINMYSDTPDDVCLTELAAATFGKGTGYGKKILGTRTNVSRFTQKDVFDFKKKYYTTDKIVLSFVGDVDFDEIFALCERYFGKIEPSKSAVPPSKNLVNLCKKTVVKKDVEQEHVALGFSAPKLYGEFFDEYKVAVLSLGGGMSSRLFQKIREEMGLCYTVESYITPYKDAGIWAIYAGVKCGYTDKTIAAIKDELKLLKEKGITEDECSIIKEQLKSSLAFAEESTSALMAAYAKTMLYKNEIFDPEEEFSSIEKLNADKVNEVIFSVMDLDNFSLSKVLKSK